MRHKLENKKYIVCKLQMPISIINQLCYTFTNYKSKICFCSYFYVVENIILGRIFLKIRLKQVTQNTAAPFTCPSTFQLETTLHII